MTALKPLVRSASTAGVQEAQLGIADILGGTSTVSVTWSTGTQQFGAAGGTTKTLVIINPQDPSYNALVIESANPGLAGNGTPAYLQFSAQQGSAPNNPQWLGINFPDGSTLYNDGSGLGNGTVWTGANNGFTFTGHSSYSFDQTVSAPQFSSTKPFSGPASPAILVSQTAHGFTTGNAIYYTGSAWAKAKANSSLTLALGIAVVIDANTFYLYQSGYISGLTGLTPGSYYYVSDSSAGALTTTAPTASTSYSSPILFALSATTGMVLPYRPSQNTPGMAMRVLNATMVIPDGYSYVICGPFKFAGFTLTLNGSSKMGIL